MTTARAGARDAAETTPDYSGVVATLETYLDGPYESDTSRLARVFHAEARYVTVSGGDLLHLDMPRYFAVVDDRPSPASRGETRRDRIAAIEFAGPGTAFARVQCAIGPKRFTDFLTLIRDPERPADGWRIIAKVFHYDVTPET